MAAQLIPRFFKYFPTLSEDAFGQHVCLCEDEELGVSLLLPVQAVLIYSS